VHINERVEIVATLTGADFLDDDRQ